MGWRFTVGTLITVYVLIPNVLCLPSLLAGFKPDPRQQHQHKQQQQQHQHHEVDQPELESAENLNLNADGSYSYKYRLSDGTFSYAKANSAGEVNGGYGYKNEEGQDVVIEFQANKDVGFQPRGSHLNEVPALPGITNEEAIAADVNYDENADRSYKFEFEGDDFSRNEESDSTGQITGNYRFVDNDGQERSVSYKAGAGIGFVPEADFIPQDANQKSEGIFGQKMAAKSYTQSTSQTAPAISILPPPPQEHSSRQTGYPAAVKNPQKFYSRPQKTPVAVYSQPQGSESSIATIVESSDSSPAMIMDASYSFAYDNDLTAREESADRQGNVNGQYTYVNTEGNLIQVKYSAGAEKGFVIENESELSEAVDKATQDGNVALQQEQQSAGGNRAKSIDTADITFVGPNIDDSTWIQSKSYTFGFRGQDSSRSEVSDENGNVRGTYTIPDTEGKPILVRYTAGPKKGFVIENLEEVQRRTGQLSGVSNVVAVQPKQNVVVKVVPRPVVQQQQQQQRVSGYATSQTQVRPQVSAAPIANQNIQNNVQNQQQQYQGDESDVSSDHTDSDKSYNFEFGLSDNQRKETADEEGNVQGQYEYVTAEGNKIRVTYSAGPGKGFVIENQEDLTQQLAKATYDGAAALDKVRSESESSNNNSNRKVVRKGEKRPSIASTTTTTTSTSSSRTSGAAPLPISTSYLPPSESGSGYSGSNFPEQEPEPQTAMDASFSFAVDSSNSNHQESADSTGERQGSYSYTSPEGKNVVVRYRAGRKGFVILNPEDVIPKAF